MPRRELVQLHGWVSQVRQHSWLLQVWMWSRLVLYWWKMQRYLIIFRRKFPGSWGMHWSVILLFAFWYLTVEFWAWQSYQAQISKAQSTSREAFNNKTGSCCYISNHSYLSPGGGPDFFGGGGITCTYAMQKHIRVTRTPGVWSVRAWDAVIAESENAFELNDGDYTPVIYFPRENVSMALLKKTDQKNTRAHKSEAGFFRSLPKAKWSKIRRGPMKVRFLNLTTLQITFPQPMANS